MVKRLSSFKSPVFAASALAFSSLGDAFLYAYLPLYAGATGLSLTWVGVVLSVNRFIRLLINTPMVRFASHYGLRTIALAAVLLAILSTAGYAFSSTIVAWIVFRVLWGIAYAALRLNATSFALYHEQPGVSLGFSKSIQDAGPLASMLLAPLLLTLANPISIFVVLALLSLPALYFVLKLPAHPPGLVKIPDARLAIKIPSTLNLITFLSTFLVDGVVVIALGILFLQGSDNLTLAEAAFYTALLLGYRRVCQLVLAPVAGWIADKTSFEKVFAFSLLLTVGGLVLLAMEFTWAGAIIVFTFQGIQAALAPATVAASHQHSLLGVAENATWRDTGAACGTLLSGFILSTAHLPALLLLATIVLAILFLFYLKRIQIDFIKFLLSWK